VRVTTGTAAEPQRPREEAEGGAGLRAPGQTQVALFSWTAGKKKKQGADLWVQCDLWGRSTDQMRSFKKFPGPTVGSWSTSPTKRTWQSLPDGAREGRRQGQVQHRGLVHDQGRGLHAEKHRPQQHTHPAYQVTLVPYECARHLSCTLTSVSSNS